MISSSPSTLELDRAVAAWLRDEREAAVALRRVVGLYYGHESWVERPSVSRGGREPADAWQVLLGDPGLPPLLRAEVRRAVRPLSR